ncbi:MAG: hypothetical protein LM577_09005 [Thermoproteaceae archaeon]|nr:hypothetical protein [Thermoproteaceae archaeon]
MRVVTVTNVVGSTTARESDVVIYTRAGPEIGAGVHIDRSMAPCPRHFWPPHAWPLFFLQFILQL